MTKTYNHDDNIPDHDNPNYCVITDTWKIGKKIYNVKCTANRPSKEALMELAKLILEIY